MGQQSNGHNSFAQAHLISQNAVQAASVDGHEPVQSDVLVLSQPVLQQKWHLRHAMNPGCCHQLFPHHDADAGAVAAGHCKEMAYAPYAKDSGGTMQQMV